MNPVQHPTKSSSVRQVNEKNLLRLMHNQDTVTQADLAIETGLQPSTVYRIFKSLEERGVIEQVERRPTETRQGRRPGYYRLVAGAAYSLGVDLAHRGTAIMLVDYRGNAVTERESEFSANASAENVLEQILDDIRGVMSSEGVTPDRLLGIGIGAPGVIDIDKGTVVRYARLKGMEGLPLRKRIGEALGVPVFIHNNASVIALAENRYGRAAGHESVVAFLIRAGVGGAFVKSGSLYTSQGMTAFELGHTTLNVHESSAEHRRATLEDILCESGLVTQARLIDPSIETLDDLVACLSRPTICRALDPIAEAFCETVRNLALVLNPEAFMIVARRSEIADFFAVRLRDYLDRSKRTDRFNVNTVIPLQYDPILACRGAADLVFDDYFST